MSLTYHCDRCGATSPIRMHRDAMQGRDLCDACFPCWQELHLQATDTANTAYERVIGPFWSAPSHHAP